LSLRKQTAAGESSRKPKFRELDSEAGVESLEDFSLHSCELSVKRRALEGPRLGSTYRFSSQWRRSWYVGREAISEVNAQLMRRRDNSAMLSLCYQDVSKTAALLVQSTAAHSPISLVGGVGTNGRLRALAEKV